MASESNVDAVNVVIEKLSELVAQNNAVQQETAQGQASSSGVASQDIRSGQKRTIDTAKHLIEYVKSENLSLSFTRTPTKSVETEPQRDHEAGRVTRQSMVEVERSEKSEEEIIVNLPANLGQLNLTNKRTLIESLMNLNASLQEKNDPAPVEKRTEKEATYKCTKCDYCSHNKYYLKQHVELVHNAERPFKCPFCDYAGKRSHSLKEHLVVHSTNRPYECNLCNATFRKKGHLTNHIKMHANSKNFECNICEEKFGDRYMLYDHLRSSHPPESHYACDFCEYATTIRSNIEMHMHTHGNPKSYKCDKCGYIALHINIMREHAIGHGVGASFHEEAVTKRTKPVILLKCAECGFTTDEKAMLNDHMLKHIGDLNLRTEKKSQGNGAHDMVGSLETKEPTTYVCRECDFTSSEAYAFITHMLSHKTLGQVDSTTVELAKSRLQSKAAALSMTSSSGLEPMDVSQQWTHDSAVGLYRCTICGYFTKHQRTIKSHIWKHSGHKDIDYPMFQNGPLSVYDDVPIGKTTLVSSNNIIQMAEDEALQSENSKQEKKTTTRPRGISLEPSNATTEKSNTVGAGPEVKSAPTAASTGTPKVVHVTTSSARYRAPVGPTTSEAAAALKPPVTRPSDLPLTTSRKPTIQVVDKSQQNKPPLTVLVSKPAKQVILLTTSPTEEGKGKFAGKIHKMIPARRSQHPDSEGTSVKEHSNRPIVVIQKRASGPAGHTRRQQAAAASPDTPQGSSSSDEDPRDAGHGQTAASIGKGADTRQLGASASKQVEVESVHEMQRSRAVVDSKSEIVSVESGEKFDGKEAVTVTFVTADSSIQDPDPGVHSAAKENPKGTPSGHKRGRTSSSSASDSDDSGGHASKRARVGTVEDEDGNVVVETITPVFSTQPFALSESRGSSPRIINSPRISDLAAHSDSSDSSGVDPPSAVTEVTIVEMEMMDAAQPDGEDTVDNVQEPQVRHIFLFANVRKHSSALLRSCAFWGGEASVFSSLHPSVGNIEANCRSCYFSRQS